jgi:hypothetical protein
MSVLAEWLGISALGACPYVPTDPLVQLTTTGLVTNLHLLQLHYTCVHQSLHFMAVNVDCLEVIQEFACICLRTRPACQESLHARGTSQATDLLACCCIGQSLYGS